MEERDNSKLILGLSTVFIVVFVCIAIFALIQIWKPKNNTQEQIVLSSSNDKIGTYKNIKYTEEQQISQYIALVTNSIVSSDTDKLYSMLNDEYKDYFSIDKTKAENMFKTRGFLGKMLTSDKYTKATIEGRSIYIVPLKTSVNGAIYDNVIITEYSPRRFSIAFDDFLTYDKSQKEYYRDELKLVVYNKVNFITSVSAKVKITNLSDERIIINDSHKYENFYIRFANQSEILTNLSFLSGESYEMIKNQELAFDASFEIPELSHQSINSYVLKDVKYIKNGATKDLEFNIK